VMQLGAGPPAREQIAPHGTGVDLRHQHGDAAQPERTRVDRRRQRVIGAGSAEGEHGVGARCARRGEQEFELADLVAAVGARGAVVAFDVECGGAGAALQRAQALDGGRAFGERDVRQTGRERRMRAKQGGDGRRRRHGRH